MRNEDLNTKANRVFFWMVLSALLLIAFTLRVQALETIPPGLTHDEAGNGHDAAAILKGDLRIYFPIGYGREPLYTYSVALLTGVLGPSIFTLRMTTFLWSILTWVLTVALARRWWGNRGALLTGALLTCTFWPLMLARVGLRAPTLPPLFTASILVYDHALQPHQSPTHKRTEDHKKPGVYYLLSGLFLGLSLYTYMASRGMPLVYIAFLVWAMLLNRSILYKGWRGTLGVVAVALLISTPLFLHLRTHPELEYRLTQLSGPIEALKAGNWQPLWHNITASLPMLGWRGDPLWLYNIGGRPVLEVLPATAFWLGVIQALRHLRVPHNALLLLWTGAGLTPAFITGPEATTLRAVAALPALYLLSAQGLNTVYALTQRKLSMATPRRRGLKAVIIIALSLGLLFTGAEATSAYFKHWGEHRDVRVLYLHHLVALGRALRSTQELGVNMAESHPIVITTIYPGEYHDPYTMEVTLQGKDLDISWMNGNGALFFPRGESHVYTETLSKPHPILQTLILDHARPKTTLTFRPDDLIPAIYGYRWDSDAAWATLRGTLDDVVYIAPGDPPPAATPHIALRGPIPYDNALAMLGYRITTPKNVATEPHATPESVHPGDEVAVLSAWEVQTEGASLVRRRSPTNTMELRSGDLAQPIQNELVLFTHLLNSEGTLIRQADRLDAPSWQWKAGDRFAQIHTLTVPAELSPGSYWLAIGLYRREDLHRMPVNLQSMWDDDDSDVLENLSSAPITRVLLPLEIARE